MAFECPILSDALPMADADPHDRLRLQRLIGEDAIFKSLDDVVEAYQQKTS